MASLLHSELYIYLHEGARVWTWHRARLHSFLGWDTDVMVVILHRPVPPFYWFFPQEMTLCGLSRSTLEVKIVCSNLQTGRIHLKPRRTRWKHPKP